MPAEIAPTPPTPPATPQPEVPSPPYRSARTWAIILLSLLALTFVLDAVAVGSDIAELRLLGDPSALTDDRADANDDRQQLIGQLQLGLLVVTAFFFIVWLHRVTANLRALRVRVLRFGPGWAIGAWFVPILNLWRPKQVVDDAWRGSDPELPGDLNLEATQDSVPLLLAVWWTAWIASNIVGRIAAAQISGAEELAEIITGSRWLLATDCLSVLADVTAFMVVLGLSRRQARRAEVVLGERSLHGVAAT